MRPLRLICILTLLAFWVGDFALPVQAAETGEDGEKIRYYDFYLTGDRQCKKCAPRWINSKQVELTNQAGDVAVVTAKEIIGYDNHPILRRILRHSIQNQGIAGPIIMPYAFDDYKDYTCKYCDEPVRWGP